MNGETIGGREKEREALKKKKETKRLEQSEEIKAGSISQVSNDSNSQHLDFRKI